jgi:hypothetical protein
MFEVVLFWERSATVCVVSPIPLSEDGRLFGNTEDGGLVDKSGVDADGVI